MELVKRKILLEDYIDRSDNSPYWGVLTATTFYVNIFLNQDIDDMGLFTDIDFISANTNSTPVDYTILINKLSASGITFPFMYGITPQNITGLTQTDVNVLRLPNNNVTDYYNYDYSVITGITESRINDVMSYNQNNRYIVGFDLGTDSYLNYENVPINGVDRVISVGDPKTYVFDTPVDQNMGTNSQQYGLQFKDFTGMTNNINGKTINLSEIRYIGEAKNETNTSLSAITKEEYLFGIISPPEIKNDVFIDRGITTVMERHLKLSEIKNLGQLNRYGNGFYKLNRQ